MDLPYKGPAYNKFITNVGLVGTNGPWGPNIMSSEWTHLLSYSPGLLAVCIGPGKATNENIAASKRFAVSLASTKLNVFASIAGNNHGKEVDKIAVLKELGFHFFPSSNGCLFVEGASLHLGLDLQETHPIGDHTMFVGAITEMHVRDTDSLAYHEAKFWKLGEKLIKPPQKELDHIAQVIEKHRRPPR